METFLDLLRRGNLIKTSAAAIGHSPVTISAWVEKGKELIATTPDLEELDPIDRLFVKLASEIEAARAQAQINAIEVIRKAAQKGNVAAATWYLERSDPENWGRVVRQEITGEGGGPVQVDVEAVSRKIEALAQNLATVDAEVISLQAGQDVGHDLAQDVAQLLDKYDEPETTTLIAPEPEA